MSSVNSINSTLVSGSSSQSGFSEEVMGKEDFLKLLVAQLQHQDPLNPQDPTEFTSQLAQYSQVEQSMNMNKNLENLAGMTYDMERMSALGMIGKDVTISSSGFLADGTEKTVGYQLGGNAAEVKVHILDANGNTVRTIEGTEFKSGDHFVTWDGKDKNGNTVEDGTYFVSVMALDADEKKVASQPLVKTKVTGLDLDGEKSYLTTEVGTYGLNQVQEVQGG